MPEKISTGSIMDVPQSQVLEIIPSRFKFGRLGAFILMIDVELAWGFIHSLQSSSLDGVRGARSGLEKLFGVLEKFSFPVTWAVLARLFLDSNEKTPSDLSYQNMDMLKPTNFIGNWHNDYLGIDARLDELWHGRDIVQSIIGHCRITNGEMACHSFSHVNLGDLSCSVEVARSEVERCVQIMKRFGIRPISFVFPYDSIGHLDVLKENGFISFRGSIPSAFNRGSLSLAVRRIKFFGDILCDIIGVLYQLRTPNVVELRRESAGLWNISGCLCYQMPWWTPTFLRRLAVASVRKGVDKAIHEENVLCIYTHCYQLGTNTGRTILDLENIIAYSTVRRRRGLLWVTTLGEAARYFEAVSRVKVSNISSSKREVSFEASCDIGEDVFGVPEVTFRITLPASVKTFKACVDGEELRFETQECYLQNESESRYAFITVRFVNPVRKISLFLDNG